jgi:poly-gamma-glutamate capsule biosynthesis protein CapA/YwtB (metallophosphatase superfamily)
MAPDVRIIDLETSITRSDASVPKAAAADSGQKLQSARKPGDIVVVSIHWAQTGATKFRRNIAGSHTRLSTLQTSPSFTVTLPITP